MLTLKVTSVWAKLGGEGKVKVAYSETVVVGVPYAREMT